MVNNILKINSIYFFSLCNENNMKTSNKNLSDNQEMR